MTERILALTYHITMSSQGPWLKCPNCGAADGWSPEFGDDQETIVRYVCLGCGVRWIEAHHVVDRAVASPCDTDPVLAAAGDAVREGYAHLRVMANDLGLDRVVQELDDWWGDSR